MIENVTIYVGTVTGTARDVAQHVKQVLEKTGVEVELLETFEKTAFYRKDNELVIACTSNTGAGDIPENMVGLYYHLTQDYPNIAGKKYAVINLGDSSFITFGEAGKKLDDAFMDIGANNIAPTLLLDAIDDTSPTDAAVDWAKKLPLN